MEPNQVLERLRQITNQNLDSASAPEACWLDGQKCPYGFPNGKYQDRPEIYCHLGENGCKRLEQINLDEFGNNFFEKGTQEALDRVVKKEKVTLSGELKMIATDKLPEGPSRETLILTADIIEGDSDLDKDIVRVEDIKENF